MSDTAGADESLFPIAVLIDELRHEDVQVTKQLQNLINCPFHIVLIRFPNHIVFNRRHKYFT